MFLAFGSDECLGDFGSYVMFLIFVHDPLDAEYFPEVYAHVLVDTPAPSKWERITSVCHNRHQIALSPSLHPCALQLQLPTDSKVTLCFRRTSEGGFIVTPQTATGEGKNSYR